jgi:Bacterial Ig-like domain
VHGVYPRSLGFMRVLGVLQGRRFSFGGLGLNAGENGFELTAQDLAGNRRVVNLMLVRAEEPDATNPTLTARLAVDTGSSSSDRITNDSSISGQAGDDVGVVSLQAALNPGPPPSFSDVSTVLLANGTFTISRAQLNALAGGTLPDGNHTLLLIARDAAGNSSAAASVSFTLDTAAPNVVSFGLDLASDTGAVGDNITAATTVQLVGATEFGSNVRLMAGTQELATSVAATNGSFSFGNIALELGDKALTLNVIDTAGNASTRNLTVKREPVTTIAPVSLVSVSATALSGVAANSGQASAISGQLLTLNGTGFGASLEVVFQTVTKNGVRGEVNVQPSALAANGTQAQVFVPVNAVTGSVRVVGDVNGASVPLQIVPVVTSVQVESVSADGSKAFVIIKGHGLVEGNDNEYRFGSGPGAVVLAGYSSNIRNDLVNTNSELALFVPLSNGAFGAITVKTAGGLSEAYAPNLASISSVANSGMPADATQASANPNQTITLMGSGLSTNTSVLLRYTNESGLLQMLRLSPRFAEADGTRALMQLPWQANGASTLQIFGSSSQTLLQIVPTLEQFYGASALYGSGFVEGATRYDFPGLSLNDTDSVDADRRPGVDVTLGSSPFAGVGDYAGLARFSASVLPHHGTGLVRVTTAGGTSAGMRLNVIRPGSEIAYVGALADVALNAATGALWVLDSADAARLLRINTDDGLVLQSTTLNIGTSGNQYVVGPAKPPEPA